VTWDNPQPGEIGHNDDDPASKNPTGRKRKSSAGQRRKKDRKLFGGTPWSKPKPDQDPKKKGK
jgi:hypothetical protein